LSQLAGTVTITTPAEGTLIYSEVLRISGTAEGLPDGRFRLRLSATSDETLASRTVTVADSRWQVDLLHGYADVPSEVLIGAYPLDSSSEAYDLVIIALGGLDYRPEGRYAAFTLATTTLGGDVMPVSGIASGFGESPLLLRLLDPAGDLISEASIFVDDPYHVNEIPWSTDLERNAYTGDALLELRDGAGQLLDSQDVTIEAAAG
jgi:hypothetical protein